MAKTTKTQNIQKVWEEVKAELEVFDTPTNAKGETYTRYVWDNECEALKEFWAEFDIKSRKALGLTCHKVGDDLLIYELGFDISKKKATPKKGKSVALKAAKPKSEWASTRLAKAFKKAKAEEKVAVKTVSSDLVAEVVAQSIAKLVAMGIEVK